MDDKDKLIELRTKVDQIYTLFGFLFCDSGAKMRPQTVKRIADLFHDTQELYRRVSHRITTLPIPISTPLFSDNANSFSDGAVTLAGHCQLLGDLLVEQIEAHVGKVNFRLEGEYYRMLKDAAETEINQAIIRIDNPKAVLPAFSFKEFMPAHFVLRSELVNKGSKKGLLGISSGRLTQLQQREENPFPKPLLVQGRVETYLVDEVEAWEKRESERKSS
jgi:hypothetical protein